MHRDVTKTKPSHYKQPSAQKAVAGPLKPDSPRTTEGAKLADEVRSASISADSKTKLIREIIEYESSHGLCTKTFSKKVRKQIRPGA